MAVNLMYHRAQFCPEDEVRLIERAKTNPENFAPLYNKYYEPILRYVFKRVDEEEIAYDITSMVFIKAIQSLPKYEYRGVPFASWLFRIAKSELYQSFRDAKARRTVSIDTIVVGQFFEDMQEDVTEANRDRLLKAMSKLKENQLQLIEMRFFEKRSFKEIGDILEMTENNAKVKTFRALAKLKEIFKVIKV